MLQRVLCQWGWNDFAALADSETGLGCNSSRVYSVLAALALPQGLLAVDPGSGAVQLLATRLSDASLARPRAEIRFCNDVDVSRKSGKIYFSGEQAASSAMVQAGNVEFDDARCHGQADLSAMMQGAMGSSCRHITHRRSLS